MPALAYRDEDGVGRWSVSYLTTGQVPDVQDNYVYPQGTTMTSVGSTLLFGASSDLAPTDWYACPRAGSGYWGDYYGLTQFKDSSARWWNIAAFSASRGAPPCGPSTDLIAEPLHVAGQRW